jgi:FixJ family two-component response regulator
MVQAAGARAFLVKPVERESMLATVRSALEGCL